MQIVYENELFLVINKPVGVVVNRADSVTGETVQDWVENQDWFKNFGVGYLEELYASRSGICHRLDKETSGCLLIAKNPKTLKYFLRLFKERKIKKEYLALVHGNVSPNEGGVVLPMRRGMIDREKWQVHYEGKKAITYWKVVRSFDFESLLQKWNGKLTLLRLDLKTGRTHQIRVHLSFLGWPIFADERYLNKEQLKSDEKFLNHHFLHSEKLGFVDESGKPHEFVADMPEDCQKLLGLL